MSDLQDIREMTVYTLANVGDAPTSPSAADSPGASFLDLVRTDFLERFDYAHDGDVPTAESVRAAAESVRDEAAHEIADGAVPIYTYQRWQTFTDLAAWEEDTSELGDADQGMTALAGVALYMIAERLVRALADSLDEWADELEEGAERWLFDSTHATVADRDARIAELAATRDEEEIAVELDDAGNWRVLVAAGPESVTFVDEGMIGGEQYVTVLGESGDPLEYNIKRYVAVAKYGEQGIPAQD